MDRLLVAVLGNRNSGKSKTWNTLFGTKVKTGKEQRPLRVSKSELVDVFVVSGSPQERDLYVKDVISDKRARIVLCSVQYKEGFDKGAWETFNYFIGKGFTLFVQWLNPGRKDKGHYPDHLGLFTFLLHQNSIVSIRSGKYYPRPRVEELRQFIYGWAAVRGLTYSKQMGHGRK